MLTIAQITTVERNLSQIALEASVLTNMVTSIKNIFPSLITNLRSSFSQTEHLPKIEIALTKEQQFLIKEIQNFKFIDIAEIKTQVPEGFIGTYLDYTETLLSVINEISSVNSRVLQPYSVYLSTFLTNKEAKINTKDQTRLYNDIKKVREKQIEDLSFYFKDSSNISVAKVGQVIKRNADFLTVYNEVGSIAKKVYSIDIKSINENVKRCVDMLDIIVNKINRDEITNVSPEVTQNLAFGAYEVAKEIEFFSVLYYKILALTTTVDETTIKVNSYIKNLS